MSDLVDGRYRIIRPLGSGSMGVVYLAEEIFLGRRVAIKVIDPGNASDPSSTERFVKEARALAQIRHHNVVQIFAFGPHDLSFYFAMEYVEGRSLEAAVDAGETVDVGRALEIIRAVAHGLDAVHERKLVHRDVKPGNIVIEHGTNRPVLIDFGLARRKSASSPRVSITAGTPWYMAPEQATDADGTRVTFKADIYALACTAYELLTGRGVFDGKDIFEVLKHHLTTTPPSLSSRRPDLAALDPAFFRALAKDPLARHESAGAFAAELDAAMKKRERTYSRDTVPPPSSIRRAGPAERVIVLGRDEAIVRSMSRVTTRSVATAGRTAQIQHVATGSLLLEAFAADRAAMVLIDDDSTEMALTDLVKRLRELDGGWAASVLVASRNFTEIRGVLAPLGVRDVLPKPLVVQMLASAVDRIVSRRSAPDSTAGM